MIRRLLLLLPVALVLAPGTWVRSPRPAPVLDAGVEVAALGGLGRRIGALEVQGGWELASRHAYFGSYSGLLALPEGGFLAASDRGKAMRFAFANGTPARFVLGNFGSGNADADKTAVDIEALAQDPATGRIWAAYELRNMVERRERDLSRPRRVFPQAMAGWSGNKGPEAMTRLADGRFLMLGEGRAGWLGEEFPGLMWPADPVEGREPLAFTFRAPEDFRPTDMAGLPDGRVLILVRRVVLGLPPHFEVRLLVADPASIAAGRSWRGTELARFAPPFPTDNYEGIAVDPGAGFPVTLTMISDDNEVRYQRTLLLRLRWDGELPR